MFASANGIRLHFEIHGRAEGIPLLLIHGFPLSGELWSPMIELLSDRFRLIIPDLRGHGRSEVWKDLQPGVAPPLSIAQYADDLATLLELIGEGRSCVIVGLSMGGYIAFELYRQYASIVRGLVLADTRAAADTPEKRKERQDTAERVLAEGSRVVADAMAQKLFSPAAPEGLRRQWRQLMSAMSPESMAAATLAMGARIDSTPTLAAITCPTLIIVGADDLITPPEDARVMHRAIGGSSLEIIPGAGHMTPVEQPQIFAQTVREFIHAHFPQD